MIRPLRQSDLPTCGKILHEGFLAVSQATGLPPETDSAKAATAYLIGRWMQGGTVGFVIEEQDEVLAFRLIDMRAKPVAGLGPLVVSRSHQAKGHARSLISHTDAFLRQEGYDSARLVQSAYNARSLQLFLMSGFDVREPLANLIPGPHRTVSARPWVRPARETDVEQCSTLCQEVLGFARTEELNAALKFRTAVVVERENEITGYATAVGAGGHGVGRTTEDLCDLIAATERLSGPGLFVPLRDSALLRWCFEHGFQISRTMNLMVKGPYQAPAGAFMPSTLF